MKTEMTFEPVKPRRKGDSQTMQLWSIVIDGKVVGYTDEPETLVEGLPRIDNFDEYVRHGTKIDKP